MNLHRRILVMLIAVSVIFSLMIFFYLMIEQKRLFVIHQAQGSVHENVLDKIVALKGESLRTLVSDYTYWDEMVTFVQTPDPIWAKDILDTALPTYNADGLWVYGLNGQLIHSTGKTESFSIPPEIIPQLFASSPSCHFYISSPQGVWEIRGATIHASGDHERTGTRHGYFFAGRRWSDQILNDLGAVLGAEVYWDKKETRAGATAPNITLSRVLEGWDGRPVRSFTAVFPSPTIANAIKVSKQVLRLFLFFGVFAGLFVWVCLFQWISRPLRLLSSALKEENTVPIEGLQKERTEVGDLARLIKQFFEQKQALVAEINERKRVEKDLWETQAQLFHAENLSSIGRMAAGVSNEINSPVGYIITNLEVLEQYLKSLLELIREFEQLEQTAAKNPDPVFQGSLQQLRARKEMLNLNFIRQDLPALIAESRQGAERIQEIVELLSSYSHREAKEKTFHNVNRILDTCLRLSKNDMREGIKINKELGEVPSVLCNQQEIIQVFLNILLNAVQAVKKTGEITIKSFADDKAVYVKISDTGEGIPAEHRDKVFEPFFSTKNAGTGLGLSLAASIIQKHKGAIRVESDGSRGTTFTIELPITKDDQPA